MDTISKQVRRAQRRLMARGFARALPWCLCVTLLVAAVLVAIAKFFYPPAFAGWQLAGLGFAASAVGAAMIAGLLAAAVCAVVARGGKLAAAVEIDRRFGLRERVSSTLALRHNELDTPAGRALVADAQRRVERVHVAERFKLWSWSWSWLSLAVPAVAFALALLLDPSTGENPAQGTETILSREQIKQEAKTLRQKLIERRKEAREKGLKDAERIFEKLEQGAKEMVNNSETDRRKALVELNDLAKELEKRRDALGGSETMKNQLNNLKDLQRGPADKFAQALKDGDFRKAMKELGELQGKLADSQLDAKSKKELADQLEGMQSKLQKMADAHKKAMDDLKEKIARKQQAGDKDAAQQLQEQLDRLAQQSGQMKQMSDLAQQLGECAECLKNGQQQEAMEGIAGLEAKLSDLQQQLDEMQMLDDAMAELGECKNGLNGMAGRGQRPGPGMGNGQGAGDRPLDRTSTGTYNTRVRQKVGPGSAVVTELVDGQNVKGEVQQQIKTELETARTEASDPITDQKLPRAVKDHVREYIGKLREGE